MLSDKPDLPPDPLNDNLGAMANQDRSATYMSPADFVAAGERCFGAGWQQTLAAYIGYARNQIGRYANGQHPVPVHVAIALRYMVDQLDKGEPLLPWQPVGRIEDERFIPN